jgi:hypothetical protein
MTKSVSIRGNVAKTGCSGRPFAPQTSVSPLETEKCPLGLSQMVQGPFGIYHADLVCCLSGLTARRWTLGVVYSLSEYRSPLLLVINMPLWHSLPNLSRLVHVHGDSALLLRGAKLATVLSAHKQHPCR